MEELQCIGPGVNGQCERTVVVVKRSFCKAHYSQFQRGQELKPIMKRGGHNRKYPPGTLCGFVSEDGKPCGRNQHSRGYCSQHLWQYERHGLMWPIGENRGEERKVKGYEVEHTCTKCKKKKNWRSFVMGTDATYYECRACYRTRLLGEADESKPKGGTMEDLLNFIEKQVKK